MFNHNSGIIGSGKATMNPLAFGYLNVGTFSLFTGILFVCCLFSFLLFRRLKGHVRAKPTPARSIPRFRKRDKLRYYAVHYGRRFSSITEKLKSIKSPEARQKLIITFVKKVLNVSDEPNATTLNRRRLPESFYEPDEDEDSSFPDDLKLMINSIRVFGHLDKSFFIEFCKFIQPIYLDPGQLLFHIGDPDENVYVVQSGVIQLYTVDADGSHSVINEISRGGSIDSFMSVLNVLIGNTTDHQAIEAAALEKSTVLKLPIKAFLEICKPQTPALFRILQMITIRLQRLTAVAVQSHLGLYSELIKKECIGILENSKAQQCLLELNFPSETEEQLSDGSNTERLLYPGLVPDAASTLANARGSICPLVSDCVELNTAGEVVTEFEHDFENTPDQLSTQGAHGRLELGEAPSILSKSTSSISSLPVLTADSTEQEPISSACSVNEGSHHALLSARTLTLPRSKVVGSTCRPPVLHSLGLDRQSMDKLVAAAEDDLSQVLKLPDASLLRGNVSVRTAKAAEVLVEVTEIQMELYYVISGELRGIQPSSSSSLEADCILFSCFPGDVIGLMGLITGEPVVYSLKTARRSIVASISRENFYAVLRQNPDSLFSAIRLISTHTSPLLNELDFAIQWITVMAGKALYKKGDPADHVYVVLSGRLRQVDTTMDSGHQIVSEPGRGDLVGFLEVICSQNRVHTVIAIRDSEVAQIPALLLHRLKHKVPQLLNRIIQLLSGRLLGHLRTPGNASGHLGTGFIQSPATDSIRYEVFPTDSKSDPNAPQLMRCTMSNLRTIAILPTSSSINAEAFVLELQHSLTPIGSSVRLTSHIIRKRLGPTALSSVNQYRFNAWLSHQEDLHRIVFFVCNHSRTSVWNRLCIRQADCVLVLALGNSDPSRISSVEMMLKNHPTKVVKALVLMYPLNTDYPIPRQAAKWLNVRPWISHHYHIRCESRVFTARDPEDLVSFYSNVFACERPNPQSDFSRLARYLTGEAVGLVLGGGGARGCAHIGVIRAFVEAGIPIDLIGGTSMGAFMSALWAQETRFAQFTQRARNYTRGFNSIWNKLKDFTYPAVSIFSGKEFNDQLFAVFGDNQVEDLWIPSFYVTTDITNCRMRVHTQGSLWRYVRASMSLSGYLPPLCDPYDGSLLLDGGYINNVPADLMSIFGAKTIFAVDVGAAVDTDFSNYGDHLSGWNLLYNRLFGSSKAALRVPNLSEIQSRLAYISCVRHLEHIKGSGICHYLRPPIDRYMTLQFTAFEEILNVGYEYAKKKLMDWYNTGMLRQLVPGLKPNMMFDPNHSPNTPARSLSARYSDGSIVPSIGSWLTQSFDDRRSFVDLAETFGPCNSARGSPSSHSEMDSGDDLIAIGGGFADGIRRLIKRSSFHLPKTDVLLHSNPFLFAKSQQNRVASLSRAVYSYLDSAKHLVSRTLPNTGLFRRRALSDYLRIPSDSGALDSSDDTGNFSDAHDYPSFESLPFTSQHRTSSLTELRHVKSASTASALDRGNMQSFGRSQAFAEQYTVHRTDSLQSVKSEVRSPNSFVEQFHEEGGYMEDSESIDLPDFALIHESVPEVGNHLFRSIKHSPTKSSEDQSCTTDGIGKVRNRKLHRRSSLDQLRSATLLHVPQHSD